MNWIKVIPLAGFFYLVVLIITRIVTLKKIGVPVNSDSGKSLKAKSAIYTAFFLIVLFWLFELINQVFQVQMSLLPYAFERLSFENVILKITGNFIILVALVLITVTISQFGNSLRFGLNENNQGELITNGIFSVSRNPFFLSLDLYFSGIAILFPNLFFVIYAAVVITTIHFFILKEEKFLKKVYGEEYKKYSEKVGRYFSI